MRRFPHLPDPRGPPQSYSRQVEAQPERVRLAELLAALSLGIDLGFGQPMEHILRQCRIALRIAELVGLDEGTRSSIYYSALLVNVGCHTDAHEQARWFGDDLALKATKFGPDPTSVAGLLTMVRLLGSGSTPLHRIRVGLDFAVSGRREIDGMLNRHADLARSLGEELELHADVLEALASSYERWDGKGYPDGVAGGAIPVASRIAQLAEFLEVAHRNDGVEGALDLARRRSGSQFDPALVDVVIADSEKVFHGLDDTDSWDAVIDGEPALAHLLTEAECDDALAAIGRYVDLKSPYTAGHSAAVAHLAETAAAGARAPSLRAAAAAAGRARVRLRAAGRVQRHLGQARLTDRIELGAGQALPGLHGADAASARRRWRPPDASPGRWPSGSTGPATRAASRGASLTLPSRILATAALYQTKREPRPHRPALGAAEAAALLRDDVRAGRLDGTVVDAVLHAAGERPRRRPAGPAGLTARELEVLLCLVRGLSNREIGQGAGDQPQDRRQPRRARVREDRREQPRGCEPVRDAARAGAGGLIVSRSSTPAARWRRRRSARARARR